MMDRPSPFIRLRRLVKIRDTQSRLRLSATFEFMMLNKKKSAKSVSFLRVGEHNVLSWLSSSQSARKSAKVAGTLFSVKSAKSTATLPDEPLSSDVQALLNSAAGVIECATGGHGRCVNSGCRCRCHKSRARARVRSKRRISI